jgi:hypothetical protein
MAVGIQRTVRRALLTLLKGNSALLVLVPKAQINPADEPAWPFVKLSSPVTQRLRAACVVGGTVSWDIHAFARARESGGAVAETAEDHASRIGAAIETALADNRIALEGGGVARITLSDIRLLEDGGPDAFHWFAQVNARVLAA